MRNIALRLAYDGSAYHGFQAQKGLATVQTEIEKALSIVTREKVRITGCGRTDAGVHARTYVANFRTNCGIPADRITYAVNTKLPRDIAVFSAVDVEDRFHSTFSSIRKEYTYVIKSGKIHDPFYANKVHFYPHELDIAAICAAAERFVGKHDFAAMRSVGSSVKTTVRVVHYYDVFEEDGFVQLRVCANGFLYNMARAMAGTLMYVSEGKLTPDDVSKILESGKRSYAGPTLPPGGLYMSGVWYENALI